MPFGDFVLNLLIQRSSMNSISSRVPVALIILKDIYLQVLPYFTIFTFFEVLREFAGLWFDSDIRPVTIESSTQLL